MVNNMKLAVFSDIHGNYQALKSIIKDIKGKNVDKIIFLGDAVSLGPNSNECLDLLFKENISFILGNHEIYCIKGIDIDPDNDINKKKHNEWVTSTISETNMSKIKELNLKLELTIDKKKYTFIHFFLEDNIYPFKHLNIFNSEEYKEIMNNIDSDYIFYGHDHEGRVDYINGKSFYGIGSSGCRKDNTTYYYIIDTKKDKIKKIPLYYDRNSFLKIINNSNYPNIEKIKKDHFGIRKDDY